MFPCSAMHNTPDGLLSHAVSVRERGQVGFSGGITPPDIQHIGFGETGHAVGFASGHQFGVTMSPILVASTDQLRVSLRPVAIACGAALRLRMAAIGKTAGSPTFLRSVSIVILDCAKKQMVGVNATGTVAMMQNPKTVGDGAICQNIGDSVRQQVTVMYSESPVSMTSDVSDPVPAVVRIARSPHARPVALLDRFIRERENFKLRFRTVHLTPPFSRILYGNYTAVLTSKL